MALFHHILVPVDGSKHAAEALKFGLELSKLTGAQVHVIHVIDTGSVSLLSRLFGKSQTQTQEELRERAMGVLIDANAIAREVGVEITTHMEEGVPYEAVVDHVERHDVDLIVIGRVGTRGPRRILIGSMTERVIETVSCHVLVIR